MRFWNNLHQLHSKSKYLKAKYFKNVLVLVWAGGNKNKEPKEDSQNRVMSPMPERA
jgi:hypothetical protein